MSEIVIKCVICGDKGPRHHNHLHLNPEKQKFYCHLCGKGGTFSYLRSQYPEITDVLSMMSGIRIPTGKPSIRYSYDFYPIHGSDSILATEAVRYAVKRGLRAEEISRYNLQISPQLLRRVIFPDLIGGVSAFWTARAISEMDFPWRFPAHGETKFGKGEAVWGLNLQERESEIWITEGIFDAIAVGGVAVYGKRPSVIQMQKIFKLNPRRLVIAFDRDAKLEARSLQEQTRSIVPTGIELPPHEKNDFGELMSAGWRRCNE